MNFCSYCPALLWSKVHLVLKCTRCPPLVASEILWPKAFFLTEFMPFKLNYNSIFLIILVKNSNLVFQPIWQPYTEQNTLYIYIYIYFILLFLSPFFMSWTQRSKTFSMYTKGLFPSNIVHKCVWIFVSEHFSFAEIIHPPHRCALGWPQ